MISPWCSLEDASEPNGDLSKSQRQPLEGVHSQLSSTAHHVCDISHYVSIPWETFGGHFRWAIIEALNQSLFNVTQLCCFVHGSCKWQTSMMNLKGLSSHTFPKAEVELRGSGWKQSVSEPDWGGFPQYCLNVPIVMALTVAIHFVIGWSP